MAKLARHTLLLILCSFWIVPLSFSGPNQSLSTPPSPPLLEADFIRIDGDRCVVKDIAGTERQIHVGKDTEIFGHVKAGDRIQLWVQPDGHTRAIIIVKGRTP